MPGLLGLGAGKSTDGKLYCRKRSVRCSRTACTLNSQFTTTLMRLISFFTHEHLLKSMASPSPQRSKEIKRSEEHTSELQSPDHLVCRLLLAKKNTTVATMIHIKHPTPTFFARDPRY